MLPGTRCCPEAASTLQGPGTRRCGRVSTLGNGGGGGNQGLLVTQLCQESTARGADEGSGSISRLGLWASLGKAQLLCASFPLPSLVYLGWELIGARDWFSPGTTGPPSRSQMGSPGDTTTPPITRQVGKHQVSSAEPIDGPDTTEGPEPRQSAINNYQATAPHGNSCPGSQLFKPDPGFGSLPRPSSDSARLLAGRPQHRVGNYNQTKDGSWAIIDLSFDFFVDERPILLISPG